MSNTNVAFPQMNMPLILCFILIIIDHLSLKQIVKMYLVTFSLDAFKLADIINENSLQGICFSSYHHAGSASGRQRPALGPTLTQWGEIPSRRLVVPLKFAFVQLSFFKNISVFTFFSAFTLIHLRGFWISEVLLSKT